MSALNVTVASRATGAVRRRGYLWRATRRPNKDILQFAPNFTAYVLPPDVVCLYSEDRKFFLHGELYCTLAAAIGKSGKRAAVLIRELAKNFPSDKIEEALKRLIEQARAGKAAPDDLRGSTFTITNLGMYDIDAFTPIINLPECAILGVGRIVARPVVLDENAEKVAVRKMMALSLTFDHRLVDGAPAARFLQHVKRWVEQPYGWLTS